MGSASKGILTERELGEGEGQRPWGGGDRLEGRGVCSGEGGEEEWPGEEEEGAETREGEEAGDSDSLSLILRGCLALQALSWLEWVGGHCCL